MSPQNRHRETAKDPQRRKEKPLVSFCAFAGLCAFAVGCASTISEQTFFGRSLEQPKLERPAVSSTAANSKHPTLLPAQGGDALIGQGAVIYHPDGPRISLRFANHGSRPVRFSYVTDEYLAKTAQGRTEILEKGDFLTYPDVLKPGDEQPVTLQVPKTFPVTDITSVMARIDNGHTILSLRSIVPHPPAAWPPAALPSGGAGYPVVSSNASNVIPVERAPIIPEGPREPEAVTAPAGTVPVEIEFTQQLGQALSVEVQWDGAGERLTLRSQDRQVFYVVPGHHELRCLCRMSGVADTTALIPLDVSVEQPLRVALSVQARLNGAELTARAWKGPRLLIERTFAPGTTR